MYGRWAEHDMHPTPEAVHGYCKVFLLAARCHGSAQVARCNVPGPISGHGGGERGEGRAMTLLPKGTAVTSIAWAIAAMATLHGGEWMRTCIGHSARTTVKARW